MKKKLCIRNVEVVPDNEVKNLNPSLTGKIIFHKFSRYFV